MFAFRPSVPPLSLPPRPPLWLHEIKHDGFRVIACKDGGHVRLYSRPGNDLTKRFPLIVETLARLRCKSCVIDGEAVACGADGRSNFDFIRYRHHDEVVFLYAFDLLGSPATTAASRSSIASATGATTGLCFCTLST